jgi:hypothetical protein
LRSDGGQLNRPPNDALAAFNAALALAPGRLGALQGAAEATRRIASSH